MSEWRLRRGIAQCPNIPTLVLREPGAPLHNNTTKRALERASLHRKDVMFYTSENGAHVGDLFMSLIRACQRCDVSPFAYVTTLRRHVAELSADPGGWTPWNYRNE